MKTLNEIPNYRMIKVSFVPPTNTRGARIKIYETNRYNDTKTESKIFSLDYNHTDIQVQAIEILQRNGFEIVCRGSEHNNYVLMCDSWGADFKSIKDLK